MKMLYLHSLSNVGNMLLLAMLMLSVNISAQQTKLIGTTRSSVFSINPDGTDAQVLIDFSQIEVDQGVRPAYTTLTQFGDYLYGVTSAALGGQGTVFKVDLEGNNYESIFTFNASGIDGDDPQGTLLAFNDRLWGMTKKGGTYDYGVIFSILPDGNDYTIEHHFNGTDGAFPNGNNSLIEINGLFWGLTVDGGNFFDGGNFSGGGVLFSYDPNISLYTVRHKFNSLAQGPQGQLLQVGNNLWGTASRDSPFIFSYNLDSLQFTAYETLSNGIGKPTVAPDLTLFNDRIYGTSLYDGQTESGSIFSIDHTGQDFRFEYSLTQNEFVKQGEEPWGGLLLINDQLWGMTRYGGQYGVGTLYSFDPASQNFMKHYDFNESNGSRPRSGFIAINNSLFGLAESGGFQDRGTLFEFRPSESIFILKHKFGDASLSLSPSGKVTFFNNRLWGLSDKAGEHDFGAIYSLKSDGSDLKIEYSFTAGDGQNPKGSLVSFEGKLYGVSGNTISGNIFSFSNEEGYKNLAGIGSDNAQGELTPYQGRLYGVTAGSGSLDDGTIFSILTTGEDFKTVYTFNGFDGSRPNGKLIIKDGYLYGTTREGGSNDYGVIFKLDLSNSTITKQVSFNDLTGHPGIISEYNNSFIVAANDTYYGFDLELTVDETLGYVTDNLSGELLNLNNEIFGLSGRDSPTIYSHSILSGETTILYDTENTIGTSLPQYYAGLIAIEDKAVQNISFSVSDKTYGDNAFELSASSNSSNPIIFTSSDPSIISIDGKIATINNAGVTTITATQAEDEEYNEGSTSKLAVVKKASLIAQAQDVLSAVGQPLPILPIIYSDFVNGDDESVLDIPPFTSVQANETSPAGEYVISISEGLDNNYDITSVPGILTIVELQNILCHPTQIISFSQGKKRNGGTISDQRSDPEMALGQPQENDTYNFVSLGFGGSLTLELEHELYDDGTAEPEMIIVETSFGRADEMCYSSTGSSYPEQAFVEVSADNQTWYSLPNSYCRTSFLDIKPAVDRGLPYVRYVRITDITDKSKFGGNADGFDVDGLITCPEEVALAKERLLNARTASTPIFDADFVNKAPNEEVDISFTTYPNPVQDGFIYLNILSENVETIDFIVYDQMGRKVLINTGSIHIGANNLSIPVSRLESGVYIYHAQMGKNQFTGKFIK